MSVEGVDRSDAFIWPPGRGTPPLPAEPQTPHHQAPHWLDASWPRDPSRVSQTIGEFERVMLGGGSVSLESRASRRGWRPEPVGAACWRCAESVGLHEVDDTGCSTCRGGRPPWARFIRLGVYDGLLRDSIHELKFQARRGVGMELGRLLGLRLESERRTHKVGGGVIVPVPISTRRRIQRGVDHTAMLARGASLRSGLSVQALLRRLHRPSQLSVPISGREANVRGSIRSRRGRPAPGDGVVVVLDDVRTTGATMRAACRAVMDMGVERDRIWACVAGVRDAPDREGRASGGPESEGEAGEGWKDRQSFSSED